MASSETVGEFLIKMGIDADGVDRKVNDVVNNIGKSINNFVTGVLAPAMAGLASFNFVQSFADEITQVDRLSESLGVNIEQLSAWRTAAEMAGVEADEVGEIFADFNDWMVDAKFNEGGAMYTDFISKGLLPAVTDANGELKKTEDYILEFADALHKMDKAQASGIARQIGLSDLKTATWLQQGGDAIREQLNLAKEIGTFTEKDAAAAREYTFTMNMLTHSLKMAALPVFRLLVPLFGKVADVMQTFTEKINNFFSSFKDMGAIGASIARQINLALSYLSKNIMAFAPLLAGVGLMKLIDIFKNMATAIKTASIAAKAFILSPWGIALTSLLAIGIAVQDFMKWLNGDESNLANFFENIFGDTDTAKEKLNNLYNGVMDIISNIYDNFLGLIPTFEEFRKIILNIFSSFMEKASGIVPILEEFGKSVLNLFSNFIEKFSEQIPKFEELGKAILNLFSAIIQSKGFELFINAILAVIMLITSVITWLINFLAEHIDIITELIGGIAEAFTFIAEVLTTIVNFISDIITSIVDTTTAVYESLSSFVDAIENVFNAIGEIVDNAESSISGAIDTIINTLSSGIDTIKSIVDDIGNSINNGMNSAFSSVSDVTTPFIENITNNLSSGIDTIKSIVDDIGNSINNGMNSAFSSVSDVTTPFIENITNNLSSGIDTIKSIVDDIGNSINSVFDNIFSGGLNNFSLDDSFTSTYDNISSLMASISDLFNSFSEPITNDIGTVSSAFIPFIDVLNNLYNVFDEVINFIIELCTYLVDTISSGIDTIINLLYSLMNVVASVGGLISGVFNSMASSFSSFVNSVVSGANSIVGSIQGILNKLAELASNSLLGKILGSVGGSIYGALNNISSSVDNSNTTTNYDNKKITIKNFYPGVGDKFDLTQGVQAYL